MTISPVIWSKVCSLGPFKGIEDVGRNGILLQNIGDRKRVAAVKRNVRPFNHNGMSIEDMIALTGQDKLEQLVEKILDHKRERNVTTTWSNGTAMQRRHGNQNTKFGIKLSPISSSKL